MGSMGKPYTPPWVSSGLELFSASAEPRSGKFPYQDLPIGFRVQFSGLGVQFRG